VAFIVRSFAVRASIMAMVSARFPQFTHSKTFLNFERVGAHSARRLNVRPLEYPQ
jgi:hypothetical protein